MRYSHEASIPVAAGAIDLAQWLFDLSEADYGACARGHRAIGVVGGDRRSGMVNVESIGGSLLIQHYATRLAAKDHVTMVSEASRAYLMHVVPVRVGVVWDMRVFPDGPETSRFQCTIDVAMPLAVRVLGLFNGTGFFVRRHLVEETHGFARDIARKCGAGRPSEDATSRRLEESSAAA